MAKNIVICSDGTGNSSIKDRGTNVFKLFEAVDVNGHRTAPDKRRQMAFYDDGVGTERLKWVRAFAGATGFGLSRNVKQLYTELCRVYRAGDDIYLFGFSRGAFTVRTLAGMIDACGILDVSKSGCGTERDLRRSVRLAYKAYRRKYSTRLARMLGLARESDTDVFRAEHGLCGSDGAPHRPTIRFIGVWDTVDAVGLPFGLADFWNATIWRFKFRDNKLNERVVKACHALALDDERAEFAPVLWDESEEPTRTSEPALRRIEQVWFPGAHSNVGGGYPQQGMSLVALDWMMTRAETCGLRFVEHARGDYRTLHSFSDKLYDPRAGFGVFYRWNPRDVRRLCARCGIERPLVHLSAIERLAQGADGYASGNIPFCSEVMTTEASPLVPSSRVVSVLVELGAASGMRPLSTQVEGWILVGFASYMTFIAGIAGALLRALAVGWPSITASLTERSGVELITGSLAAVRGAPQAVAIALVTDRIALALVVAGLVIGWALSWISDRQTVRHYSAFWHRARPELRRALSRSAMAAEGGRVAV